MGPAGLRAAPLILLVCLLGAGTGSGRMVPDAPITHFRLPMFGENGYKSWELRGLKGIYESEDQAIVEGLELEVFSGDEQLLTENLIRSPRAVIHFDTETARGHSSLFVSGPGYQIQGRDWQWYGPNRKIVVKKQVHVSFTGSLNILD